MDSTTMKGDININAKIDIDTLKKSIMDRHTEEIESHTDYQRIRAMQKIYTDISDADVFKVKSDIFDQILTQTTPIGPIKHSEQNNIDYFDRMLSGISQPILSDFVFDVKNIVS